MQGEKRLISFIASSGNNELADLDGESLVFDYSKNIKALGMDLLTLGTDKPLRLLESHQPTC